MKSIQKSSGDSTVPARVPLPTHHPTIWEIVGDMVDSDREMYRSLIDGIGVAADFDSDDDRPELVNKLMLISGLVKTAQYIDTDIANLRDCQVEDCMLASEDPEIRKAARP